MIKRLFKGSSLSSIMGCDFTFFNRTRGCESVDVPDKLYGWLCRNITRGYSKEHIVNIIRTIIRMNQWNSTDTISISCGCCPRLMYENEQLIDKFEFNCFTEVDCDEDCPVCNNKLI